MKSSSRSRKRHDRRLVRFRGIAGKPRPVPLPFPVTPETTPIRLNLIKDQRLEIDWQDGKQCVYPIAYLRSMCPCAQCKVVRAAKPRRPARRRKSRA